jgi:hypothetical protein
MKKILSSLAALAVLAGCAAPQNKYDWGNYEQSLYEYYKAPANTQALLLSLNTTITNAEANKRTVAPGLYAEYGFLLMQSGKPKEAIAYFEKEKSKWPESAALMNRMVAAAAAKPATAEVAQ